MCKGKNIHSSTWGPLFSYFKYRCFDIFMFEILGYGGRITDIFHFIPWPEKFSQTKKGPCCFQKGKFKSPTWCHFSSPTPPAPPPHHPLHPKLLCPGWGCWSPRWCRWCCSSRSCCCTPPRPSSSATLSRGSPRLRFPTNYAAVIELNQNDLLPVCL